MRAAGTREVLRLVPQLAGVPVEDSLVLVLFAGKRATGALRVDLPHGGDETRLKRWAGTLIGTACRARDLSGVIVVAYTPDSFAPSGRAPAAEVLRAVARRARTAGLQVQDVVCVAADAWGSLNDPALPRGGRPLADIVPEAGALPRRGRVPLDPGEADEAVQDRFADHLEAWWTEPEGPGGVLHGVDLRRGGAAFGPAAAGEAAMERYRWGVDTDQLLELVERSLDPHDPVPGGTCACRALVYSVLLRPGLPSMLLAQFGFGIGLGAEVWAASGSADPAHPGVQRLLEAFGGDGPRPDLERLHRAEALLLEIAALVGPDLRAPVDAGLAWLAWAQGGGTLAAGYARRALRADPDHELAALVLGWADAGRLPGWAFDDDPASDPFALPAA